MSTSGYQDIVLTYATDATSTGFNSQVWSYSTDGIHYTSFATITSIGTTYSANGVETINFSTVTALDNDSIVYFELTLNGASGATGSDHFDNIQFNASTYIAPVPESAVTGPIFSFGLLAVCALRESRYLRQKFALQRSF